MRIKPVQIAERGKCFRKEAVQSDHRKTAEHRGSLDIITVTLF